MCCHSAIALWHQRARYGHGYLALRSLADKKSRGNLTQCLLAGRCSADSRCHSFDYATPSGLADRKRRFYLAWCSLVAVSCHALRYLSRSLCTSLIGHRVILLDADWLSATDKAISLARRHIKLQGSYQSEHPQRIVLTNQNVTTPNQESSCRSYIVRIVLFVISIIYSFYSLWKKIWLPFPAQAHI